MAKVEKVEAAASIGELTEGTGSFCVWMTAEQGDVVRRALDEWRETYLRWGRRHMGWAVFVTRPAWRRP